MFAQSSRLYNVDPLSIQNPEDNEFVTIYRNKNNGNYYGRLSNGTDEQINGGSAAPGWLLDGNTVVAEKWFGTIDNFDIPVKTNGIELARFGANGSISIGGVLTDPFSKLVVEATASPFLNGVVSTTVAGYGVIGNATGAGYGVRGYNAVGAGYGIEGVSEDNIGVYGKGNNNVGVYGESAGGFGVYGIGQTAIRGTSSTDDLSSYAGIFTNSSNERILTVEGSGNVGIGQIVAISAKFQVQGVDSTGSNYAVKIQDIALNNLFSIRNDGLSSFKGEVVIDATSSPFLNGLVSTTVAGYAIQGNTTGAGYGVRGFNATGYGVGVEGVSVNNVGVFGSSTNGIGLQGLAPIAIYGKSSDATASTFALQCVNVASSNLFVVKGDASSWFYGLIKNGAGTTIMDINGGFSIHNNAGNPVIYLGAAQLYTNGGLETLDWANRRVKNSGGVITMGWESCELKDAADLTSMLWSSRTLHNNVGAIVIDYSKPTTIKLPGLQTGNAGLALGETYIDTAANILLNGDKIVAIKV